MQCTIKIKNQAIKTCISIDDKIKHAKNKDKQRACINKIYEKTGSSNLLIYTVKSSKNAIKHMHKNKINNKNRH